jgi:hypothetical protein
MQRKQFEKKLIQLFFEQRNLSKQISNLGYEKLDPPVQRGWRRFFVLRKDVARSDDALFFQKLLDKINTIQYSSKNEFKVKHRKFGKKIYEERQQNLERIFPDAYTKKEFTEREKKYFYPTLEHDLYWKRLIWVYRFLEPWRFELKIEPNIIYRTKIKDFNLIKRLDEMHQYLEWNDLQTKQCRLMHGHYQDPNRYWYSDLERYRNPFRNKRLVDILSEYEAENLAETINEKPSPDEGFFISTMCAVLIYAVFRLNRIERIKIINTRGSK